MGDLKIPPFEVGDVVRIDPGDNWRRYCGYLNEYPNEGKIGIIIDRLPNSAFHTEEWVEIPDHYRTFMTLEMRDGQRLSVHWSKLVKLGPLEALGACAE